jgi:hypothetical protein
MKRDPKETAKQLTNYADAVTAFAFLQSLAFAYGTGKDLRDVLLKTRISLMVMAIVGAAITYLLIIIFCQQSEKTIYNEKVEKLDAIADRIGWARFTVVLLSLALSLAPYLLLMHYGK